MYPRKVSLTQAQKVEVCVKFEGDLVPGGGVHRHLPMLLEDVARQGQAVNFHALTVTILVLILTQTWFKAKALQNFFVDFLCCLHLLVFQLDHWVEDTCVVGHGNSSCPLLHSLYLACLVICNICMAPSLVQGN